MQESFKMALKSIWGNKMRSFLTMLGIIIGVASVIILVSIVNGYMATVVESFASMGVNQISVNVTNLASRSLDVDDMYDFFEENRDSFDQMTPVVSVSTTIKSGNENLDSTSVAGYSEDYLAIKDYELTTGRNIQYSDLEYRQKVCVIGYYVAQYFYGGAESALGETLKIGGSAFKIVGVVECQDEDNLDEGGTDDFVWIPYTTAIRFFRNGNVTSYIFTCSDVENASQYKELIENFLYESFKSEDLYRVNANSEMLDQLNEQIAMMSAMLGGIAGISLLVAGVGVMNIMLVSVTERTREIGIRKALGARKSRILQQFVIEAAVTSSIGGIIGIFIGSGASVAVGSAIGISSPPTLGAVLISFSVSVGIGLVFGYMPARRAALLNPIDALRSE